MFGNKKSIKNKNVVFMKDSGSIINYMEMRPSACGPYGGERVFQIAIV